MANTIDYEQMCKDELLELEKQEQRVNETQREISRLKLDKKTPSKEVVKEARQAVVQEEQIEEDSFEDELAFYLNSYRQLSEDFSEEELRAILPKKKHPKYKDILLRLSLESVKEIKEVTNMLRDNDVTDEEEEICFKVMDAEKRKIEFIRSRLVQSEKQEEIVEEEKNNIVLVPTLSGNIRVLDDLEHIPSEYYDGFRELISSIVDGTFKGVKMFASNSQLFGISEVKAFKIRVVFTRLSDDTYAIITAFVKKTDKDKLYNESLNNKGREYRTLEPKLKENLNNREFMEENEKSVQQLWNILAPKSEAARKELV